MRILIFCYILIIGSPVFAYSLITKTVEWHKVRIFHVPKNDDYMVSVAARNEATSLKNLISESDAVAGINGAYFTPKDYTGKSDSTNTIRVVWWKGREFSTFFPDTGVNGLFWFLKDGTPILLQNNVWGDKKVRMNINSWRIMEVHNGIANFPILLMSGVNMIPKYIDAWLITEKMRVKATKSFICVTKIGDIKMGTITSISITDISLFIKQFWCVDAINLDSGWSLALYDRWKYIVWPGRNIMDAFIIKKK